MITQPLLQRLRAHFALDWTGIHGSPHWQRVRENGLRLAADTGASTRIVEAFAFVHDSCRMDDYEDPEHGARAAAFAPILVAEGLLALEADELELLVIACAGHNLGGISSEPTVGTCWDADRLDLGRVGIRPRAQYLCTEVAKDPAVIEWAYGRSRRW